MEGVITTLELLEMSHHGTHGIMVLSNRQRGEEESFGFVRVHFEFGYLMRLAWNQPRMTI